MLARRTLELRTSPIGLQQTFIARETLVDCGRAEAILQRAQEQAEAILDQARQEAELLREAAERQFWQEAQAVLSEWEAQRQSMWAHIETSACQLVNTALNTLLADVPDAVRVEAIVNQIARCQSQSVAATLHCHREDEAALTQVLNSGNGASWRLYVDNNLRPRQLKLITEGGSFYLDWSIAVAALELTAPQN